MRSFFIVLTVLSLSLPFAATGQAVTPSLAAEGLTEDPAEENLYVHYNSSLLFPGEYFLYSLYNLKAGTGEPSLFSKIAYVELVDENNNTISRQKVKLEKGRGNADFYVPTSTPSGSYKLIAYTNWMKNFKNAFFEADLVVINPYQSDQKRLLETSIDSTNPNIPNLTSNSLQEKGGHSFDLKLNKEKFENREKVTLELQDEGLDSEGGRYSLSVRRIGDFPVPDIVNSREVVSSNQNLSENDFTEKIFLPELRGQLISGQIISGANASPVSKRVVALSIPGNDGLSQMAITNTNGQFFFNLDEELQDENAVLEVLNGAGENLKINLDGNERGDRGNLNFLRYTITPEMEEEIVQRSLYNQIENAYFSVKPDTLVTAKEKAVFPSNIVETYNLDEYTRFKGVPETFVEIIKSARVIQQGRGNRVFEVRGLLGHLPMGLESLLMVDGLLVQDHSVLMDYDARRIQTIKIIRDKIYLGPEIFQGAIIVETKDGDFPAEYTNPDAVKVEIMQPELGKRYFEQTYTPESRSNRIPDYRYQLLWEPSLEPEKNGSKIEFFTSDVDGNFEVVLEGFMANGRPVSARKVFTVE